MIRMQDLGEIGYGGAVTLTAWWDQRRIDDGRITKREILKKASFWTYLGVGIPVTLMSAFGWWRRWERWFEHMSHGFLYDMPRFIFSVVQDLREEETTTTTSKSEAVKKAQEILNRKKAELSGRETKALKQGAEDVRPGEVPVTDYDEILA